jgi:hypothetical protein
LNRKFPALASISILALTLILSYFSLYGKGKYEPIFINGDFKYWTKDSNNGRKPYCWQIDRFQSANDSILIFPAEVDGLRCLAIEIYQDGEDGAYPWVTAHVRQEVRGEALRSLFDSKIGIWVHPSFSYAFDETTMKPKNAFGIEVNDGENLIWFLFSDKGEGTYTLPHHRIVVLEAPLGEWSYHEVDVAAEYGKLTRKQPNSISIILLMGVSKDLPGKYIGYFANMTTIRK